MPQPHMNYSIIWRILTICHYHSTTPQTFIGCINIASTFLFNNLQYLNIRKLFLLFYFYRKMEIVPNIFYDIKNIPTTTWQVDSSSLLISACIILRLDLRSRDDTKITKPLRNRIIYILNIYFLTYLKILICITILIFFIIPNSGRWFRSIFETPCFGSPGYPTFRPK